MIPIGQPLVGTAEAEAAAETVLSGWLTQGPQVAAFEAEFAAFVGAPFACAVSNCTTALHLALQACGVEAEREVIVPSHTFVATANAIRQCGGTPVFVDIDPATFNLDPNHVARALSDKTAAIVCVHQMGMPCDLSQLVTLARNHGVPLIEDAACAAGSQIRMDGEWQRIGRPHGDVACFSFHPRKVITTGDGGMLTTRHPEWDRLFRLWRQHGMSVSDTVRHGSATVVFETYPVRGYNYRMTDLQAAVGREQLKRLPEIVAARRRHAEHYAALLEGVTGTLKPREPDWARSNWQSYCVRLPPRVSQRRVMQSLLDRGIATRRGIMCCHREAAHADLPKGDFAHSEAAQDRCILLPLYAQMSRSTQAEIVEALALALMREDRVPRTRAVPASPPGSPLPADDETAPLHS
ncbi:DegT/DnrJ/EryC1/StrS aminotransferase family protein [Aureimonas sp. AU20]|uniref:DegT/DnrJ/EryC1/StrS family aminotransferase n=1 Tax=Aureimonas sp. AU20 TaxID=1349819 RepID=UPI000721477A|nr:DegT/DnrJ/EryC1/StrS family aminotransferase [Aureimonas sp. AU20]ALN74699.1 hypothetical protein M673_18430 [Aureimonas sp. AU20]